MVDVGQSWKNLWRGWRSKRIGTSTKHPPKPRKFQVCVIILLAGNLSGKLPGILVGALDVNNYLVNIQRWGDASQRWNVKRMFDYLWYSPPLQISWNLVFSFHVSDVFFSTISYLKIVLSPPPPKKKIFPKLDPVGSTVRYEMMKLCTGPV